MAEKVEFVKTPVGCLECIEKHLGEAEHHAYNYVNWEKEQANRAKMVEWLDAIRKLRKSIREEAIKRVAEKVAKGEKSECTLCITETAQPRSKPRSKPNPKLAVFCPLLRRKKNTEKAINPTEETIKSITYWCEGYAERGLCPIRAGSLYKHEFKANPPRLARNNGTYSVNGYVQVRSNGISDYEGTTAPKLHNPKELHRLGRLVEITTDKGVHTFKDHTDLYTDDTKHRLYILKDVQPVVFHANWCKHCGDFLPRVKKHLPEALLIDIEKYPELAKKYQIKNIPTTVVLLEGRELTRFEGALSEQKLEKL